METTSPNWDQGLGLQRSGWPFGKISEPETQTVCNSALYEPPFEP